MKYKYFDLLVLNVFECLAVWRNVDSSFSKCCQCTQFLNAVNAGNSGEVNFIVTNLVYYD